MVVKTITTPDEIVARLRHTSNVIGVPLSESVLLNIAADLIEQLQQELIDERYRHDRYADFCVAQGEELSKIKAQQRWIPVTERLPENGMVVLARWQNGSAVVAEHYSRAGFVSKELGRDLINITHWMPLPEPPKEDE